MALDFPWEAYMEANQRKQKNQQQLAQIFGQTLGNLGQDVGQGIQNYQAKQKKLKDQKQTSDAVDALTKDNPQLAAYGGVFKRDPALMGQLLPGLTKPQKPNSEYSPIPGFLSQGHPVLYDKTDPSKTTVLPVRGEATGGSQMAGVRKNQFTMQDLPSNQGPTTAAGAAYQVKVAGRQGKSLIAKYSTPQRIGLAGGEAARAVLRASPTDEAMRNANFSDNTINHWNQLKQKLTSNPQEAMNNVAVRREMYNLFDEMDKSASPLIANQLDDIESIMGPLPKGVRQRQMGETLPDIPFIEIPGQAPQQTGAQQGGNSGWGIQRVQ